MDIKVEQLGKDVTSLGRMMDGVEEDMNAVRQSLKKQDEVRFPVELETSAFTVPDHGCFRLTWVVTHHGALLLNGITYLFVLLRMVQRAQPLLSREMLILSKEYLPLIFQT